MFHAEQRKVQRDKSHHQQYGNAYREKREHMRNLGGGAGSVNNIMDYETQVKVGQQYKINLGHIINKEVHRRNGCETPNSAKIPKQ